MRIGLFGGSFDPPHLGHTGIALAAAARLHLDRIFMAPAGRQPLKRDQPQSPYADRLAMVRLACAGHPPLEPSDIDAPRPDGSFNYTYDTLEQLRATFPSDELFCLIGADSLRTLQHWHRAAEAIMLAQWIVAARPGFPFESLHQLLPSGIEAASPQQTGECIPILLTATLTSGSKQQTLWLLSNLDYEISATALRTALAIEPDGITQHVLEPAVADYARAHQLYNND